ncbi:MAG TPA: PH domain-containing protein [Jiangellaceae bacterium]|nr:PH domain-containing protein [Jiangellaceae bacterium]
MGFPARLLGDDERVILHMRTHAKALIVPILVLIAMAAAIGFGIAVLPESGTGSVGRWGVILVAVAVILRWSLWPFLVWLSTTYTVTSERLITRQGVINRHGRDIPLGRINDVAYHQDVIDRMLRCGSLNVSAASEQGTIVLRDVPRVQDVQLEMSELIRQAHGWSAPRRRPADDPVEETQAVTDPGPAPTRRLPRDEPYDWSRDEPGEQ